MSVFSPGRRGRGLSAAPVVGVVVGLVVALLSVVFVAPSAQANPAGTGVVISEVYTGGGSTGGVYRSDYVELYNPTNADINLANPQLSLQPRSWTGSSGGADPVVLTGTIPAGGHYLVQFATGSDTSLPALPQPEQTAPFNFESSRTFGGSVFLVEGTAPFNPVTSGNQNGAPGLVDMTGWGGCPGYWEGDPNPCTSPTADVSWTRNAAGTDTDQTVKDFKVGAPSPQNSGLNPLRSTDPGDRGVVANQAITTFTVAAAGGATPYVWRATGLPAGLSMSSSGAVSGTPTAVGSFVVNATVTDAKSATSSVTFTVSVSPQSATLGQIGGAFNRRKLTSGAVDLGGESTLGNMVAEAERAATGTQLAFVSPKSLRGDLIGIGGSYPRPVTAGELAQVLPTPKALVTMNLKGFQIRNMLVQQWERAGAADPRVTLGVSKGFMLLFNNEEVREMYLNGTLIQDDATYSVTVDAGLAAGGDNFGVFANGAGKVTTSITDRQAVADYLTAKGSPSPLAVDYSQRAVKAYLSGDSNSEGGRIDIGVGSWMMAGEGNVVDPEVNVWLDDRQWLGSVSMTNATPASPDLDSAGTGFLRFQLPWRMWGGQHTLTLKGPQTGTSYSFTLSVGIGKPKPLVEFTSTPENPVAGQDKSTFHVTLLHEPGSVAPTGTIEAVDLGESDDDTDDVVIGSGPVDASGKATVTMDRVWAEGGSHFVAVRYSGDDFYAPDAVGATVEVTGAPEPPAASTTTLTVAPASQQAVGKRSTFTVKVASNGAATPTGTVQMLDGNFEIGRGTLDSTGTATITKVNPWNTVRLHTITAKYLGSPTTAPSQATTVVKVVKQTPTMTVKAPTSVKAGTKPKVTAVLKGVTFPVTGRVRVTYLGTTATKSLTDGTVAFNLHRSRKDYAVKVTYLGDEFFQQVTKKITIKVTR